MLKEFPFSNQTAFGKIWANFQWENHHLIECLSVKGVQPKIAKHSCRDVVSVYQSVIDRTNFDMTGSFSVFIGHDKKKILQYDLTF